MPGWAGKGVGPPETVLVDVTVARMVFVTVTETVTGTVTRAVVVTVVGRVVGTVVGIVTRTVVGIVTGAVTETVTGTVTETFEVAVLTTETVIGTVTEIVVGTVIETVVVGPGLPGLTEELRHPSVVARQKDWLTGKLPQGATTDGFCKHESHHLEGHGKGPLTHRRKSTGDTPNASSIPWQVHDPVSSLSSHQAHEVGVFGSNEYLGIAFLLSFHAAVWWKRQSQMMVEMMVILAHIIEPGPVKTVGNQQGIKEGTREVVGSWFETRIGTGQHAYG